jgi:hypothetical protein
MPKHREFKFPQKFQPSFADGARIVHLYEELRLARSIIRVLRAARNQKVARKLPES